MRWRVASCRVETPVVYGCLFRTAVTIVDMGDLPESHVSMPELAELIHKWPPAVINHMTWRQRELEQRRKASKREYRQKHPRTLHVLQNDN